jgi:hypothetical protein
MGSVLDFIECPNCGQEASDDFYYKTGEEYIFCQNCGYHRSATIINRDKALNELTDDDWEIIESKNPYGAYRMKHYDSVGFQCGSLVNEDQYYELRGFAQTNESVEFASVSMFVDGKIVEEVLVDNGPKVDSAGFTHDDNVYHFDDWVNHMLSHSDYTERELMEFELYYENLLHFDMNTSNFINFNQNK